MKRISVRFRPFPVWNSEGELRWLEEKASNGYRLIKSFNPLYFFERTEPESVRFCHGFGVRFRDRGEYFQLYADAGWQHVSSWVGWHYFKSSVETATDMDRITVARSNANFLKIMALVYLALLIYVFVRIGYLWTTGTENFPVGSLEYFAMIVGSLAFGYWILSYARKRQLANAEKIQRELPGTSRAADS